MKKAAEEKIEAVPGAQTRPEDSAARPAASGDGAAGADDLYRQLLSLKAEFENYRKRVDREKPEWVRLGEARLWERLLPVYDVLQQAHDQVLRHSAAEGAGAKEIVQGLELVFKEFNKIFESEGVSAIETVGKPYHHDLHEVLGAVETEEFPEGVVVEELQRGYLWKGKVLRPARVRIAKKKTAEGASAA